MRAMSCLNFYKEEQYSYAAVLTGGAHVSSAGHQDLESSASTRCEVRHSLNNKSMAS
jgi:hypothetical protein